MSHTILKPSFTRTDNRGTLTEILNGGHWETLLMGTMNLDAEMGNHYHKETLVFFYIVRGAASIRTINVETSEYDAFALISGEGVILRTGEAHNIYFTEVTDFIMLKSLRYDPANPDTFPFALD